MVGVTTLMQAGGGSPACDKHNRPLYELNQ
jgi:hypothetical protein